MAVFLVPLDTLNGPTNSSPMIPTQNIYNIPASMLTVNSLKKEEGASASQLVIAPQLVKTIQDCSALLSEKYSCTFGHKLFRIVIIPLSNGVFLSYVY